MNLLNNREIAIAIWLGFFLLWVLSKGRLRKSLLGLIKALFHKKIVAVVAFMILYTIGLVWALHAVNFWTVSLLKDTVFWFLFVATALVFTGLTSGEQEDLFAKLVRDNLKIIIIIEFLVGTYTFSLFGELFLIPSIAVIAMLDVVAQSDQKYSRVARLTAGLQVVTAGVIVIAAIGKALADFNTLRTLDSIRQLLLPPVLSLLFIPCIYMILLYTMYEQLFTRLEMGFKTDRSVKRYARMRLLRNLGINYRKVRRFSREHALDLMRVEQKEDVDRLLAK